MKDKLNKNIQGLNIMKPCTLCLVSFLTLLSAISHAADSARSGLDMIDIFSSFRFRYENDWDSSRSNSSERSDRSRMRIRARVGVKITPNDHFEFATRIRTGNKNSQQ